MIPSPIWLPIASNVLALWVWLSLQCSDSVLIKMGPAPVLPESLHQIFQGEELISTSLKQLHLAYFELPPAQPVI